MTKLRPFALPKPRTGRDYSSLDPLDSRYYDPEVARYLSEESRIAYQAYVEAALAHTLAEQNLCSPSIAKNIETAARKVKVADVYAEEAKTRHDIKALVNCIKANSSDAAKPFVHFGATSYDIIATANALQMRTAMQELVIPRLDELLCTLIDLTEKYADTVQIGRTHGQHALPLTFGFALSEYVSRLGESREALRALSDMLRGKFSGAVGAYNALGMFTDDPLAFERQVLAKVGLEPAPYSTQIIPPEGMVRLIDELTICAGIMANLAHDLRHLQRSEIAEVRERFASGQTGSSTMAHKRNPINFENIASMAKQVIAQGVNAKLNLSSEHQRDLTDSASSRFYMIAPATVVAMATRFAKVLAKLEVDPEHMAKNVRLSEGAIAAEPLYLLFARHGLDNAHETAKHIAHSALDRGITLHQAIMDNAATAQYWQQFTAKEQQILLEPEKYYTGIASKKARHITQLWRQKIA